MPAEIAAAATAIRPRNRLRPTFVALQFPSENPTLGRGGFLRHRSCGRSIPSSSLRFRAPSKDFRVIGRGDQSIATAASTVNPLPHS